MPGENTPTPEQDNLDNDIFGMPGVPVEVDPSRVMIPLGTLIDWVISQDVKTDDDTPAFLERPADVFTSEAEIVEKAAEAGRLLGRREIVEAAIEEIGKLANT
jgi:hypothetical protein